jgi:citrate lyase beta subunit
VAQDDARLADLVETLAMLRDPSDPEFSAVLAEVALAFRQSNLPPVESVLASLLISSTTA